MNGTLISIIDALTRAIQVIDKHLKGALAFFVMAVATWCLVGPGHLDTEPATPSPSQADAGGSTAMICTLEQIASLRTPMTYRDKAPVEDKSGNACVLAIRDLVSNWPIDYERLPRVAVDEPQLADCLRAGDVLLPGRGTSYPARLFSGACLPVFTAGQIFVARVLEELDPAYFCWYLNRSDVQAEILQSLTGSAIQALNKSRLQKLKIAVPPLADQRRIAELQHLGEQRRYLRQELDRLEFAEMQHACEALLKQREKHG